MQQVETFLAGRVKARQPSAGYRAAVDSVLLGAAIDAPKNARVLELGCGSGTALLIAARQNPETRFVGLEKHADARALARDNAALNELQDRVSIEAGDVGGLDTGLIDAFDAAFFNPPFFDDALAIRAPADPARRAAFINEGIDLRTWIDAALSAVKTKGRVTLIHRADRLADALAVLVGRAGEIRVKPIAARQGAPAGRVVVRARKGAKSPMALLNPLVLHRQDGSWTAEADAILNGSAGLALDA